MHDVRPEIYKYIYIYIIFIYKYREKSDNSDQQTREARSARQLYSKAALSWAKTILENATALGLAYPAACSYNT